MGTETVYFLESPQTDAIKIGKSNNPRLRVASLATASSVPLVLIGTTDKLKESEVHYALAGIRKLNEWFYNLPALKVFARDVATANRDAALLELHKLAGYFKACERCHKDKPAYHLTAEVLNMMVCEACMIEAQRIGVR